MKVTIIDGVPYIGDMAIRWAESVVVEDVPMKSDGSLFRTRRFFLRFENSWGLSIIFGSGTYSDNYDSIIVGSDKEFKEEVDTVEVAIFKGNEIIGDVYPRVTAETLLDAIKSVMQVPSSAKYYELEA